MGELTGCISMVALPLFLAPHVFIWLSDSPVWTKILMMLILIWNFIALFIVNASDRTKNLWDRSKWPLLYLLLPRVIFAVWAFSGERLFLKIFAAITILVAITLLFSKE